MVVVLEVAWYDTLSVPIGKGLVSELSWPPMNPGADQDSWYSVVPLSFVTASLYIISARKFAARLPMPSQANSNHETRGGRISSLRAKLVAKSHGERWDTIRPPLPIAD